MILYRQQRLKVKTMDRVDKIDFTTRNMSFDSVVNKLIDEYENKKKKKK